MYRKCLIMEIKDKYAIVMDDSGEFIKIKNKKGMKTGEEIYVLPEDLYKEQQNKAPVVPFTVKHKDAIKRMSFMAATLLVCFIVAVTTSNMGDACAKVMLDGNKSVEFILNDEFEILEAKSRDGAFSEKQLKEFEGKELSEIKDILNRVLKNNNSSIITGFKLLDEHLTKEELEQYLSMLFGQHIIDVDDDFDEIEEKIEDYLDDLDDTEKDRMKSIYTEYKDYIEKQADHLDDEQEELEEQEEKRQKEEKKRQEELKEQGEKRQKEEEKRQEELKKQEEKRQEELKEKEEKRQKEEKKRREELKKQEEKRREELKRQEEEIQEEREKEEKKEEQEKKEKEEAERS